MKHARRLTRLLAPLALLFALAHGVAPAQNANSSNSQDDQISRDMIKRTQQCIREARRDEKRCRRRAHGNRRALARCRRAEEERERGCSG